MSSERAFTVANATCRCGGACSHGGSPEGQAGSNGEDGTDPETVADLAERSAFTREQVREMTEAERVQLAETLARVDAERTEGVSNTESGPSRGETEELAENVGVFATLAEEEREARPTANHEADDMTGRVGVLSTLSGREAARERGESNAEGDGGASAYTESIGVLSAFSTRENDTRRR